MALVKKDQWICKISCVIKWILINDLNYCLININKPIMIIFWQSAWSWTPLTFKYQTRVKVSKVFITEALVETNKFWFIYFKRSWFDSSILIFHHYLFFLMPSRWCLDLSRIGYGPKSCFLDTIPLTWPQYILKSSLPTFVL